MDGIGFGGWGVKSVIWGLTAAAIWRRMFPTLMPLKLSTRMQFLSYGFEGSRDRRTSSPSWTTPGCGTMCAVVNIRD